MPRTAALALTLMGALPASAGTGVEFSGFFSIVGGKVISGSLHGPLPENPNVNCPCYVAEWTNFGTYERSFSLAPESRFGLQADANVTDRLSLTAQITSRGTDTRPQVQWAYATFVLDPSWDLQVGRKRIPLYFYSDFQDVGVAYPWLGLPPEIYGWEVANYNGASLRNRSTWGDTYVTTGFFAGSEQVVDSRYWLSYGQANTVVDWKNIVGASVELNKNAWTVRAVALRANTEFIDKNDAANNATERMRAYGLAVNFDVNSWFVLSEFGTNIRDTHSGPLAGVRVSVPALSVGFGYRSGAWTTFLNHAQYRELSSDTAILPSYEYRHTSMTVKYELTPKSMLKTQLDRYWEPGPVYTGTAVALRFSYDRAF